MTCLIAPYSIEILHYTIWVGIIEPCERTAAEERKMLAEIDLGSPYPFPVICEQ